MEWNFIETGPNNYFTCKLRVSVWTTLFRSASITSWRWSCQKGWTMMKERMEEEEEEGGTNPHSICGKKLFSVNWRNGIGKNGSRILGKERNFFVLLLVVKGCAWARRNYVETCLIDNFIYSKFCYYVMDFFRYWTKALCHLWTFSFNKLSKYYLVVQSLPSLPLAEQHGRPGQAWREDEEGSWVCCLLLFLKI